MNFNLQSLNAKFKEATSNLLQIVTDWQEESKLRSASSRVIGKTKINRSKDSDLIGCLFCSCIQLLGTTCKLYDIRDLFGL